MDIFIYMCTYIYIIYKEIYKFAVFSISPNAVFGTFTRFFLLHIRASPFYFPEDRDDNNGKDLRTSAITKSCWERHDFVSIVRLITPIV